MRGSCRGSRVTYETCICWVFTLHFSSAVQLTLIFRRFSKFWPPASKLALQLSISCHMMELSSWNIKMFSFNILSQFLKRVCPNNLQINNPLPNTVLGQPMTNLLFEPRHCSAWNNCTFFFLFHWFPIVWRQILTCIVVENLLLLWKVHACDFMYAIWTPN